MNIKVLYEDNHIIAVLKPAGISTQLDNTKAPCLMDEVKDYLKEKKGKKTPSNPSGQAGNVFLGLVHRLDKPVSGIVLFGKTSKGASRLSEQFRNHTIQKIYHAIIVGKPKESRGELKEKINKISFFAQGFINKTDEELLAAIKDATKTRTAELSWEVVPTPEASRMLGGEVPTKSRTHEEVGATGIKSGKYSLLKVLPKTGRFHQIRVQMAGLGNPILGDSKYGGEKAEWPGSPDGKAIEDPRLRRDIALCATAIEFKTATTNETKKIEIPLPDSWKSYL